MATPLPTPVEPSFSRCSRISRMARSLWPVSVAAFAAISCNACFFPLTFKAGMIAFGATRSGGGMEPVRKQMQERGWMEGRAYRDPTSLRQWPRFSALGRRGGRVDPAHIAVGAAIHEIDAAVAGVAEHHHR